MDKVVRCVGCLAELADGDWDAERATACPKCGTVDKSELIGVAAAAKKLEDEYLEVKPLLTAGRMTVDRMTSRQYAGCLIRCYGREGISSFFTGLPRHVRRNHLRAWPGLLDALAEAGVRLS